MIIAYQSLIVRGHRKGIYRVTQSNSRFFTRLVPRGMMGAWITFLATVFIEIIL